MRVLHPNRCLESGFEYVEVEAGEVEGGGPDISTSSTSTLDQQECRRHGRLPPELREKEGMERVRESIEATPWPTLVRVPREVPAAEAVGGKGEDCMFAAVEGGKSVEGREGPQEGAGEGEEAGACRSKKGSRADDGDDDNEDNDDQDDNLEALFEKIRSVRESALRGGSGVEDEERRARAAMAALELARVLGLDDGEGD